MSYEVTTKMILSDVAEALPEHKRVLLFHYSSFLANAGAELVGKEFFPDRHVIIELNEETTEDDVKDIPELLTLIEEAKTNKDKEYLIIFKNLNFPFIASVYNNHGARFIRNRRYQKIPKNVYVLSGYSLDTGEELMGIMQLRVADYAINLECRFSKYDNLD